MNSEIDINSQYLLLSKEKLNTLNNAIIDLYNLIYTKEVTSLSLVTKCLKTLINDNHVDESFLANVSLIKETIKKYSSCKNVMIDSINSLNNSIDLLINEISDYRSEYIEGFNDGIKNRYIN